MIKNEKGEARQHTINKLIIATFLALLGSLLSTIFITSAQAADIVPNEIQMPGTQPEEVGNFESPDKCDNCHAGYNDLDPGAEPATGWRGGAMGNAGRDPVFWATLAIAEQDFDGSGDLCIRCHSAKGWYGGRSTPTDGSGLASSDDNGIDCDTCHASTNPNNNGTNDAGDSIVGLMLSPFTANCSDDPLASSGHGTCESSSEGYYGSGMLSLFESTNVKLGPYNDAEARHQWNQSAWHRDPDFCGTCHDVSNSAVGDLAPNHGAQVNAIVAASADGDCVDENGVNFNGIIDLANGQADLRGLGGGCLGGRVQDKAAFNNPPYAYGIVERTFSEYKSSPLHNMPVSEFANLPAELQNPEGSLAVTFDAAIQAGTGGDYEDGTTRTFSCQSCHMRPVGTDNGGPFPGCNKNGAPLRADLPRHDHTGGNYWFASMSQYQDNAGTLRMGEGLNSTQLLAMDLGQERATKHLREAGSLSVDANTVTVTNLTGHKLITGYPEGRRMWLRIKWYDTSFSTEEPIHVDGDYGNLQTNLDINGDGVAGETDVDVVETIIDLNGNNTEIYEAHYAITRDWAGILQALHGDNFVLSYDRITGLPDCTVGEFLASNPAGIGHCEGNYHETFHFALNNYVSKDNRIPPYQMSYAKAKKRNALPVPETRYARTGDTYEHQDTVTLVPPPNADYAEIDLLYQGTSWEYMLFLQKANKGTGHNAFLGDQGDAMMDAWLNAEVQQSTGTQITGVEMINGDYKMVPPVVMKSATWGLPPGNSPPVAVDDDYTTAQDTQLSMPAPGVLSNDSDLEGDSLTSVLVPNGTTGTVNLNVDGSFTYTPTAGFTGDDHFAYQAFDGTAYSAAATVTITVTAGGNNDPVANNDNYSVDQDTTLNVAAPGVLNNDDPNGNSITAVQDSSAGNGEAVLDTDGSFTYTPNAGFTGIDSFTYHAVGNQDPALASDVATVFITVNTPEVCSYPDEASCTADPACEWGGKGKNKSCKEAPTPPPPSACNGLDPTDCTDDPACRWSKKGAICLTR